MESKIINKEKLLALIEEKGANSLKKAGLELRNDKEVLLAAIKRSSEAIRFASMDLLNDKDFISEAYQIKQGIFKYIPQKLKLDEDFKILLNSILVEMHQKDLRSKHACLYVNCSGWRNIANAERLFEFFFDDKWLLIKSNKNIKAYSGMPQFKQVLNKFSTSSLNSFALSGISAVKNSSPKLTLSTKDLAINENIYTVCGSFGSFGLSDTGCSLNYHLEYYDLLLSGTSGSI